MEALVEVQGSSPSSSGHVPDEKVRSRAFGFGSHDRAKQGVAGSEGLQRAKISFCLRLNLAHHLSRHRSPPNREPFSRARRASMLRSAASS